jgi:hypothetical protein
MIYKLMTTLFLFTLTLVLTILVMIHGWGLEPKSWGWIIGGGIVARGIVAWMENITKKMEKE